MEVEATKWSQIEGWIWSDMAKRQLQQHPAMRNRASERPKYWWDYLLFTTRVAKSIGSTFLFILAATNDNEITTVGSHLASSHSTTSAGQHVHKHRRYRHAMKSGKKTSLQCPDGTL